MTVSARTARLDALPIPGRASKGRWRTRLLVAVLLLAVGLVGTELAIRAHPPAIPAPGPLAVAHDGDVLRAGPAYLARRESLWVMQLAGDPAALGYQHARLASPLMVEGEERMQAVFAHFVPSAAFRTALTGFVRVRYHGIDADFPPARRFELAGEALGYDAPGDWFLSPYERLVYLHAVYDISLAFEHSPLLGCTAFAVSGAATARGSRPGDTIVGRNFDFDVDPWFDRQKVVQIVVPEHGIPFASVVWPGMTGVVTGMNAAGIWVSVNGGRAGTLDRAGVPVVFTARRVLEEASSLDEALAVVARDAPMASHILLLADGDTGESAVVERAPGLPLGVVRDRVTVVANHFRTVPYRDAPEDARIRAATSTLAREARLDALVAAETGALDPAVAARLLRDRRAPDGAPLPLGNRNALDGLVAAHSVIADLTTRELWVSEGPHALGAYRRIDLRARLRDGTAAAAGERAGDIPADPLRDDGTLERLHAGDALREAAGARLAAGALGEARDGYRAAITLRDDDHLAWRGLALVETRAGNAAAARAAWSKVAALGPESPAAAAEATHLAQAP